jgi:hypothetical protein
MTETAFTFNPFAAGFAEDPYPHYAELRANAPVYQHPLGFWSGRATRAHLAARTG